MKKRLFIVVVLLATTYGCTKTARLYPVEGPLSTQTPPPVAIAKIKAFFTPGAISVVLNDGEVCKGHWDWVKSNRNQKSGASAAATIPIAGISSVWDAVYGQGFYTSHVLGESFHFQAVASGNRGTILDMELYWIQTDPDDRSVGIVRGVARDNKGNIYKLVL